MDIFEYVSGSGYDREPQPRKSNKVVQLAKHYEECPVSKRFQEGELVGQIKYDGVFALFVRKEDECKAFSRTGKAFTNTEAIEEQVLRRTSCSGIYIGELCGSGCSLETWSGIVSPNRVNSLTNEQFDLTQGAYVALHDFITFTDFEDGKSLLGYNSRLRNLNNFVDTSLSVFVVASVKIESEEQLYNYADENIKAGHEGIVAKQPTALWLSGHKGHHTMKIVRGIDYDLLCVGYEEGTGKYAGKVANLLFLWKGGKTIKAMLGKGWTHDDAEEMFNNWDEVCPSTGCKCAEGQIFQVYALQESSKGVLRLPKVGELRFDKDVADA